MKYCIITRKNLLIFAAVALAIIFVLIVITSGDLIIPTAAAQKRLPIYCTQQTEKKIAISFDAAWGAEDTMQLIDTLQQYHVRTTFFVVGEWAQKYPDMIKALHDAGHEVQNHSDTHPHLSELSVEQITSQIETCNDKIEAVTGVRPTLLRPPYGDYNNKVIETVEGLGMRAVQWSVDSLDWKGISAEEIAKRVCEGVQPGSIVLFHNAADHTPEALPIILQTLQQEGYEIVPVSQLIYTGDYTIDHTGMQIPAGDH